MKRGGVGSAEHSGELDLASGGLEKVDSADHQVDTLLEVVDRDGELVGPVAVSIPRQQIAALFRRDLPLRAEQQVLERFVRARQADADGAIRRFGKSLRTAGARITKLGTGSAGIDDLAPRAFACVNKSRVAQTAQGRFVDRGPLTLAHQRRVGHESEPREILEDRGFVLGTRPLPIVILDAQQHPSAFAGAPSPRRTAR